MKPDTISEQNQQKNGSDTSGRKRFTKRKLYILMIIALVILTALLFFVFNLYHTPDLNELLRRAKLAKFPESIQNLHVYTRPYIDDDIDRPVPNRGELFVRFEAEPNDIDNFINNSPCIDKNFVRPLGPMPESEGVPAWWPTNDSTARRYIFELSEREYIVGMVAVYDDSNTVRLYVLYIVNPQLEKIKDFIENVYDNPGDFLEDLYDKVRDLFD